MTDFRALCEELIEELEVWIVYGDEVEIADAHALIDRARAALAEQRVGPTDEEILLWADQLADETLMGSSDDDWIFDVSGDDLLGFARAVLARWGQPAATPIPVAERWPEFSDCDPQERVWTWNPVLDHWKLSRINRSVHTHWLPANALPVPSND
jgi:hypothetical protein